MENRILNLSRIVALLLWSVSLLPGTVVLNVASAANAESALPKTEDSPSSPYEAAIVLIDRGGKEVPIGRIKFSGWQDNKTGFAIEIESPRFTDQFLSMRPFRCIEDTVEWFCYLNYPYKLRNTISRTDLRDLSYQLLFIRKKPSEFGIDAWNGLYYQLTLNDDNTITGKLMEGDLNSLASPPEQDYAYPIELDEFVEASETKRLFPSLTIK